jgi:tetratricopeptide (TPR) repeat protein
MLPPLPMLAKKNRVRCGTIIFLTLAVFIAGCTPPGPRALFKGRKLLERGDYAGAVEQFKTATTLLATNAQAWNYLGVACQRAGLPADAAVAYQRALALDRDLVEAHYNLGSLWLELNKPADARTEFTAYTLRRSNEPDGWIKLGSAQLHAGDFLAAEKSFSTVLYLNTNNAEALNGLGLARAERGRAREAVQFFAAAIQSHPGFAPAFLNLATVAQQDLHDNKLALQNYRAYLVLAPRPANWDAVNELANSLEPPVPAAAPAIQNRPSAVTLPVVSETKPPPTIRAVTTPKPEPVTPRAVATPPRTVANPPPQVVKVEPEKPIVTRPEKTADSSPTMPATSPAMAATTSEQKYVETGVTPLPPNSNPSASPSVGLATVTPASAPPVETKPIQIIQPAAPTFPRYLYVSPRKPAAGDRVAASSAFTKAQIFEQASRWTDAMQAYRQAAIFDASWFEAQYNYGVLAYRLRDFSTALPAYETALAIQPDSLNARYNFALALKAAGYVLDAVNELKKIAVASPAEVRAQLALGNLYAQQLHDPARARACYLKVLELDPRNSQANDIRFWLSANPG